MAKNTLEDAVKLLKDIEKRLEDMTPVMADVADELDRTVTDNFLEGGRPKWPGLSKTTIAIREAEGKWPGQILQKSGQLKNSVAPFHGRDYAGVDTNKKYAKLQQFGARKGAFGMKTVTQQVAEHQRKTPQGGQTTVSAHTRTRQIAVPWGNVPAREFMTVPDEDIDRYLDTIGEWVMAE